MAGCSINARLVNTAEQPIDSAGRLSRILLEPAIGGEWHLRSLRTNRGTPNADQTQIESIELRTLITRLRIMGNCP